jgi:hypothetical protein
VTIKIRNWDRWQSYRNDRGQPPWIKLWRGLLRNPDFLLLTDAQRGQLMCLWILAADHNGVINMTADEIVRVCGMSSALDLNVLKDRRFIEFGVTAASRRRQADATVAPERRHGDASESESEAEAEYCGATSGQVASPTVVMMPVKEGQEPITDADVQLWSGLYGRIDVPRTLAKMVGYWASKPKNQRKTRGGIRKSINSWLAKDDDKAPVGAAVAGTIDFEPEPWKNA